MQKLLVPIGILVAIFLGVLGVYQNYTANSQLGATLVPTTKLPCIIQGDAGREVTQCATEDVLSQSLNEGEGFWRNNTGETVVVDWIEIETTGTASSTFFAEVATSSSSGSEDYRFYAFPVTSRIEIATGTSAFVYNSWWNVPTSTIVMSGAPAQTLGIAATTSTFKVKEGLLSKGVGNGTLALGSFRVANGDYVIYHLTDVCMLSGNTPGVDVCDATANRGGVSGYIVAENATSSNRNFDMKVRIWYHY